jgi:hypothetical protein
MVWSGVSFSFLAFMLFRWCPGLLLVFGSRISDLRAAFWFISRAKKGVVVN